MIGGFKILDLHPQSIEELAVLERDGDLGGQKPEPLDPLRFEGVRRQVRTTLGRMATLLDERLPDALRTATWAWEKTGSMALLDEEALQMLTLARQDLRYAVLMGEPQVVALATEGLWALRTAFSVISLLETRLPSLIRLRTRMEDRDLMPHGRPFLDLAPALSELARRWA